MTDEELREKARDFLLAWFHPETVHQAIVLDLARLIWSCTIKGLFETLGPVENCPDGYGEILRSAFFDEKWEGDIKQTGCYSTFDWQADVEELPDLSLESEHNHPLDQPATELCWGCNGEDLHWTRGRKNGVECRYYWEGDGVLVFILQDGRKLYNGDCKKNYEWTLLDPGEDIE